MTRVLVTGTSGFIGSHLADALARRGDQVLGLDRRTGHTPIEGVEQRDCDLLDLPGLTGQLQRFQPEVIFHLAARTDLDEHADLETGYAANIAGVEHLVAAIGATPGVRRFVCTSTQLVCRIGYRAAHDGDYCPTTQYGRSKVRTEQIVRAGDGGGVPWCLVRPTTIWGARMNPHYLRFFRMLRDGRYFHVGRGPTRKSYGYIGNVVHQYLRLAEAPPARIHRRVFYLADYEPLAIEDWAERFRLALGGPPIRTMPLMVARTAAHVGDLLNLAGARRFPFNTFRLNNVLTAYQLDLSATQEICGPLPYTLQQGVDQTAAWIREALEAGRPTGGGS